MQAVGKGAGLLVREKQSWALEGAWAFAKGREILRRTGRGAWGREMRAGKTDAAEILIRKPAWSHRLCETPAVWGSLCVRGKQSWHALGRGEASPRPLQPMPSPFCVASNCCQAFSRRWESRCRALSSAPVPSSLSPVLVNPPVSPSNCRQCCWVGRRRAVNPYGARRQQSESWQVLTEAVRAPHLLSCHAPPPTHTHTFVSGTSPRG